MPEARRAPTRAMRRERAGWAGVFGATLVTAFGLVLIAIVSSVLSYFITSFAWRAWIARKRKARVMRARNRALAE